MTDENDIPRPRRVSRYQKAQARRAEAKASDNRFYASMFGLMGLVVMVALLIAALATSGGQVDVSGMEGWTSPWLGPFSKLELIGLVIIAVIAFFMYRRITKK